MTQITPGWNKLIFVLGAPRSGTTWLQLLLAQNDKTTSCQETHLFNAYLGGALSSWTAFEGNSRGAGLTNIVSWDEYLPHVRQFAIGVINDIMLQAQPSAEIFIEKTPAHIYCFDHILKVFPDAYFIEIVRDPRAMVASMRAVDFDDWTVPGILSNLSRWTDAIAQGRKLAASTDRHIRIRYEDLLSDGERQLKKIWRMLGENPADTDIAAWVEASRMENLKKKKGASKAPWDMKKEPKNFFRKGRADGWKDDLTRRQVALIEHVAKADMEELGYERSTQGLLFPWEPWLFNRLQRWKADLDWYRSKL